MSRILAIEDDPQVLDNIVDILELEDYDILTADNGRTGVEIALKERVDLIICDVMMPHLNGYEVLETLRSQGISKTVPFIFLTAKADRRDRRQGMELGADDYLTKPFTPQELLQAITARLSKHATLTQQYDEKLQEIAKQLYNRLYIEPITGLPNRLTLRKQFAKMVEIYNGKPQASTILGIVSTRIDRFDSIRRDLGYQQTDRLLQDFAGCLKQSFPEQFIAQIDNCNYVTLFPPVEHKRDLVQPILALQNRLAEPLIVNDKKIFLSTSAGIALYLRDGRNIAQLMSAAEAAIARVEQHRGYGYDFYSPIKHRQKAPTLHLEAELRDALEGEQLQVYYQPKVNLATQTIESCEALVRWQHPERGILLPHQFLPVAEEVGLIDDIGDFVLDEACCQVVAWQKEFNRPLTVAVNISGRQFDRAELRQRVLSVLVKSGLAAKDLELELTENSLIQDFAIAQRRLQAWRHLGVKIAIDDFGTGYSSLQYLQKFAFDTLKIDRCFVQDIDRNASNAAIVRATIEMSHHLGLQVVAEGVERKEEALYLQQNNCDLIQGFYFSPPLNNVGFRSLLQSNSPLPRLR
jgi:diguanylate cyclase (GGDEF)-like protein